MTRRKESPRGSNVGATGITLVVLVQLLVGCTSLDARGFSFIAVPLPKEAIAPEVVVHAVDVLGDRRKEIVVGRGGALSVFALGEKGFQLVQQIGLPVPKGSTGKTYYTFANLGQRSSRNVTLMTPEGFYYYPAQAENIVDSPRLLMKQALIRGQTAGEQIQPCDFALDLNRDGLDDLLLPEQDGFAIHRQVEAGKFEPVNLPRNPYRKRHTFNLHQDLPDDPVRPASVSGSIGHRQGVDDLLIFDANGDGLQDLIYTSPVVASNGGQNERYDVFHQRKGMTFDEDPSQSIELPYENADVTFRDINKDGRLDAVAVRSNIDIVNPKTVVKFYIAGAQQYQLFREETDRFITKDPIGLVKVADFDQDGMIDFAMTYFSYQFGSAEDIVRFVTENKVEFKLQLFRGHGARGFARQPTTEVPLTLGLRMDEYTGYPPVMMVSDMNGDKIMDILVRSSKGTLSAFLSQGTLSYPRTAAANLDIPDDSGVDLEDVNSDGLSDVIVSSRSKQSVTVHFSSMN